MPDWNKLIEEQWSDKLTFKRLVEMVEKVMLDEDSLEESANTLAADINEIMLGYYALGGSWSNFEDSSLAQKALEQRKQELGQDIFDMQAGRAKEMAKATIEWANANGFEGNPVKVWWTARPNSLSRAVGAEVDSRKNPTDTLLQFADDSFLGVSAKSTKGSGDIGFKNPGIGSLAKALNIDLAQYVVQTTQDTIDKLGLPAVGGKRKEFIRANPEIRQQTVAVGTKILAALRDALFEHLNTLDQEDIRAHIISMWMDADESYPYYIKVTGHGKKEPYTVSIMDPMDNPKLKALVADDVTTMKVGNDSVGILAGGKRIMKMRFKYASEKLASSVKLSGDPWTDRKTK
tara:strand:- start:709 stop:1749 length:1041 start_codon:yes stop_codon:yes gene_type:complete